MVNRGIDHDHPHPAHKHHFKVLHIAELEFFKIPEDLHKAIIHHINRLIVMVNITEHGFEAVAIIFFVEEFLIPLVIPYAAGYESL